MTQPTSASPIMTYTVRKARERPGFDASWESAAWSQAEIAEVEHFRPESSEHRPVTSVRLLHDGHNIYGLFKVHDRYVRCVRTEYHSEVWKDSCVEFFVEPKPGQGYFNFEFNCGGAFLCNHIVDWTRTPDGFKQYRKVPQEVGRQIFVRASMPAVINPEIKQPLVWRLQFLIPCSFLEIHVGPLGKLGGQTWRGNFFKCAEENSHPHWAAWSPVDEFNFHLPRCFGEIRFE
jgi:Carbohydrate-binding family 9